MEAAGLALSAAQTVFAALQCLELKEILSMGGYQSGLESLRDTVSTVKSVLLDADSKDDQELSHQEQDFINKLKDAVYDADDLLDKFSTLARQQLILMEGGNKLSRKVRCLFHHFEKLSVACSMSRGVQRIRNRLDLIASNASKLGFKVDYQPIRRRREETCSYAYEKHIIGREDDLRNIVQTLLDPNIEEDVSVLTIVGMGGVGKTALAQLVYNDPRIEKEFPMRLWVCVSDQDQKQLNIKGILANILKSTSNERHVDEFPVDQLVRKLKEKLSRKKYLLVLDDVWTEDRGEWLKLERYLIGPSQRGNRIVATTRSKATAIAIGSVITYELEGLSEEDSWRLFEMMVGEEQANRRDLMDIGKEIVARCANVPLAIKVVGSLLYGQDKNKWQSIRHRRLSEIRNGENDIMPILKFSYHNLSSPLKSCFTYCALFPKDAVIQKERLIMLWMAQGYIEPLDGGQSLEDAGEEYFFILLQRCFFHDVEVNAYGEIISCKIHDLMHNIAQEVAGIEICVANSTTSSMNFKRIQHINHLAFVNDGEETFVTMAKIRTYLQNGNSRLPSSGLRGLVANWTNLRALDLTGLNIRKLPDTIGELLHLRYLDLSKTNMNHLPDSITKLLNLQTLLLHGCKNLKELPKEFNKLVKLRVLDVNGDVTCRSALGYMPSGMEKLSCLSRLTMFVVAKKESSSKQYRVGELEDLGALRNLKGHLTIRINGNYRHVKANGSKGGYLSNKEHLNDICLQWDFGKFDHDGYYSGRMDYGDEALLDDLQPHHNLRGLEVNGYTGARFPRWATEDNMATFLPCLVEIVIKKCDRLHDLPGLGKLCFLKILILENLKNLEYMENSCGTGSSYRAATTAASKSSNVVNIESLQFVSLKELKLLGLPKLKGWWRRSATRMEEEGQLTYSDTSVQPCKLLSFPNLSILEICSCPNLTSIPLCPTVETLYLFKFNEGLQIIEKNDQKEVAAGTSSSRNLRHPEIKVLEINNVRYLKSMPVGAFSFLINMEIVQDYDLKSLSEVRKVFCSCSSSLRSLKVSLCKNLRSLSRGLEYLTALESLVLYNLPSLDFNDQEDEDGRPWRCLHQSLRSLHLEKLPKLFHLPRGIQYCTALQSLSIYDTGLEALPEWIRCLSSLQCFYIH